MREIDFGPGTHIDRAAEMLVAAAIEHGAARGSFNEIELAASRNATPSEIVRLYHEECEARTEAYRKSPEGIAAAKRSDDERAALQQKHDALVARLPRLDFGDQVAVLDWLCQMQEPSDRNGVLVKRKTIVAAFEKRGFEAGANCGKDYRPGDRENMFRYLVGQALDGLKNGPAIHGILHKFVGEWKAQFTL